MDTCYCSGVYSKNPNSIIADVDDSDMESYFEDSESDQ